MTDKNGKKAVAPKPVVRPVAEFPAKATTTVINTTQRTINLTKCKLKPGDKGEATPAECSTLHKYLKKV